MKLPSFDFMQAGAVRRAVVPEGDIREDIAFQNDINGLLARLDSGATPPLTALGWIQEPVAATSPVVGTAGFPVPQALRIIRGGVGLRAGLLATTHPVNDLDVAIVPHIDRVPVATTARLAARVAARRY